MDFDTVIPAAIGILIFGSGTAYLLALRLLAWSSRGWPTIGGIVTQSRVSQHYNDRRKARATVRYQYEVAGVAYSAGRVYVGDFITQNPGEARRIANRYGKGSSVMVRYHPRWPGISTLENKVPGFLNLWLGIGLFMVGSIIFGLLTGT